MADYCNNCTRHLFEDAVPEIDVYKIFDSLAEGYFQSVICEGCGLIGVARINNNLRVYYIGSIEPQEYQDRLKVPGQ